MMKSLFTSLLTTAAFVTTVTAKPDADAITTTTTSSTRLAEWGTAMATTASPTSTPSSSPSSTPTLSPTRRTPKDKEELLALCKPNLLTTAVSFDTDNSGGLSLHEFQSFIEDITGDAFDNVALEGPIDLLYDHLRNACWSIFKMPTQCGEDTTTNDDEKVMIDKNGVMNMGKFPESSKYDGNGVLLTGFTKVDNDKMKSKEEKKYELYFCEAMVTFYLMNDVQLDWTLVDGDVVESMTTSSSTEVAAASDTVENWTIADVIAAVLNATTDASDEESTNATTTSSTAAAAIIATTTTPEPTTTTVVPDEDPEVDTTAAEINIADNNNGAASIVEMEPNQPATIPLGGYAGMALGGVLLVFIIAALIVTRRRRKRAAAAANNSFDSIWVDEENNDMTNAGKAAEISSVAAMGVASTVATRLTTGDTEVTLMEKQAWTKREPVV